MTSSINRFYEAVRRTLMGLFYSTLLMPLGTRPEYRASVLEIYSYQTEYSFALSYFLHIIASSDNTTLS